MIKGQQIEFTIPETLNLTSYFLEENVLQGRGNKTAVFYRNRTYTFNDLCILTNKVGQVLMGLGVEPENRVLLILQDSPEWLASWFGTMKIGGVGTHAYTYLQAGDYTNFLELVRPKVVVVDQTTLDRVREGAKGSRVPKALLVSSDYPLKLEKNEYHLQSLIQTAGEHLEAEPTTREDIAFWNFSGGTTGKPKAVPHTHRDGLVSYQSFQSIFQYTADEVVLRVPKLFFHYSRDLGMQFPLRAGAAVVLFQERTTSQLIFELADRYKPTVLINVPTMMREMLQTPKEKRRDLGCLRLCMSSGEILSAELYEEWVKTFGVEVTNRFGSAESAMGYLCNRPGQAVPGSSGTVTPLAEVKLVDPDGIETAKGEPGVMMVRCPAGGFYYVRDPEKSQSTFVGNGWINTGDLFVQDEKDYFWYRGRADEMVKVSGVWVSPLEIERSLEKHPAVHECVVLGLEDRDRLTKTKAFVVLRSGNDPSEKMADALRDFCREQLASYKYPKVIEFLKDLPKTGQGKIDRRQLRERGL
jgi:benzoate-CoA ligase family protein